MSNLTKEEVIAMLKSKMDGSVDTSYEWAETVRMAIEALQAQPTHDRLIDADALMEYCENQKSKTISNNDIARFPTVSADRPHGEWVDSKNTKGYVVCSNCNKLTMIMNRKKYDYYPFCGARMIGEK